MKDYQHKPNDKATAIRRRMEIMRRMELMRPNNPATTSEKKAQPKLGISSPDDQHEREADEVAKKVTGGENVSGINSSSSGLQRKQQEKDQGTLMAKGEDSLKGTDQLQEKLNASKGGGHSLDDKTKGEMETKMGADLSDVKIHTGGNAHEMAEGINAKAFTHGQDVYFKNGNYDPDSTEGKELLAHELTHTQQQKEGISREIIQMKPDDPSGKKIFTKLAESKHIVVTATTGLFSSDATNTTYERILTPNAQLIATWESSLWYYACYQKNEGYVKKEFTAPVNELQEVIITPEIYTGDLDQLANDIYNKYQLLKKDSSDDNKDAFLKSIPENLGFKQRQELESKLRTNYDVDLKNIVYLGLKSDTWRRTSDPMLFQGLYRTSIPGQTETDSISLVRPENFILAKGASLNYSVKTKFDPGNPFKVSDPHNLYLLAWMIWYPNGDISTRNRVYDLASPPSLLGLELDLNQIGLYRVAAVVQDNGAVDLLMHTFESVLPEQIADIKAEEIGKLSPAAFDTFRTQFNLQNKLAANKRNFIPEKNKNSLSLIKQNTQQNPLLIYEYLTATNFGINFSIDTDPSNLLIWYIIPEPQWIAPPNVRNGKVYFAGDRINITNYTLPNGQKAYSPYEKLEPETGKRTIDLPFPAIWDATLPMDLIYQVVAEIYDNNGALLNIQQYYQYFRCTQNAEMEGLKAEQDKAAEQLGRIDEFAALIEGPILPLKGIYVNEETGNSLALNLFYGKDKKDKSQTRLLDLTIGASKSDYKGSDLEDAIKSYNYRQSYPDGHIYIYTDKSKYIIATSGGSLVERFSTWSGWLSTLFLVAGAVAVVTGQEELAPVLFNAGMATGAVTASLSIYDQLQKDHLDPATLAVDIMSLASIILNKAASGLRMVAQTNTSLGAIKASNALFAVAGLMDAGGAFIVTSQGMAQINDILDDKSLTPEQKQSRLANMLTQLMVNGAFLIFSPEESISTKKSLEQKGIPVKTLAELEKDTAAMILVNKLEREEIEKAIKNGDDLIKVAKEKDLKIQEAAIQKDIDEAFYRHYGMTNEGAFIDPNIETRYQKYVGKKQKAKKVSKNRLDWKIAVDYFSGDHSVIGRGNNFNAKAVREEWYPFNEVQLANGKRVDAYDPDKGEIISRKATDLDDIDLSTFEMYLQEMKEKYPPGTKINSRKYPQLNGKTLNGKMILEIPASNLSLPDINTYINLASSNGIELRFKPE